MTNKQRAKELDSIFEGHGDYWEAILEALDAVEHQTLQRAIGALKGDILAYGAEARGYRFAIRTLEALTTAEDTDGK